MNEINKFEYQTGKLPVEFFRCYIIDNIKKNGQRLFANKLKEKNGFINYMLFTIIGDKENTYNEFWLLDISNDKWFPIYIKNIDNYSLHALATAHLKYDMKDEKITITKIKELIENTIDINDIN